MKNIVKTIVIAAVILSQNCLAYTSGDNELVSKIHSSLSMHRNMIFKSIEVEVNNGVVTISGEASDHGQKGLVTYYTKSISGVVKVLNKMTISSDSFKYLEDDNIEINDHKINNNVKLMVSYYNNELLKDSSIFTKDGIVHVSNKSMSSLEKDTICTLASDILGVQMVIDDDDGMTAYCSSSIDKSKPNKASLAMAR